MKKVPFIVLVIAAISLGAFLYQKYRIAPGLTPGTIMVQHPDTDEAVTLSSLHDGILLVNFYASWCGPCMKEMPSIQAGSEYASDITFVGLTDDPQNKIDEKIKYFNLTFPVYKVVGSMKDQGVHTYPTTYIFDDNKELFNFIGGRDWSEKKLLDQAQSGNKITE